MSLIEGRAHIGADGELHISLPPALREKDVEYTLEIQPSGAKETNGAPQPTAQRMTQEHWRERLREFAGRIDDLTFQRPPQGVFHPPELFD